MSKPLGIGLTLVDGVPVMRVKTPDKVEDAVWEAVDEAINAGWDARRFRREAAEAWEQRLRDDAKAAREDLMRGDK